MEDEDVTLGINGGDVIQLDDEDYEEFMDLIDESNMTDGEVVNHIFITKIINTFPPIYF